MWEVKGRDGDTLLISLAEVLHDSSHDLGVDPGLQKDGVEAHLQALLAEHPETLGTGWTLVRREYPTADRPGRPALPGRQPVATSRWRSSGGARSTGSSS